VGDNVGVAVLEGDGVGVPMRAAIGPDTAAQAIPDSVKPVSSNASLLMAFAFFAGRIVLSA